ncbi:hypothetical protein EDB19DRAFT_922160 [Suillus lakei]|nr:hypothetical protein EDB19DRAFT_922160 [Suillus lakei]
MRYVVKIPSWEYSISTSIFDMRGFSRSSFRSPIFNYNICSFTDSFSLPSYHNHARIKSISSSKKRASETVGVGQNRLSLLCRNAFQKQESRTGTMNTLMVICTELLPATTHESACETLHHDHHQAEPTDVPNICTRILMGFQLIHKRQGVWCVCKTHFYLSERMKMEYSANDIATAWELHYLAYIRVALATVWTYDYVCSLHEEWTFLLRSRWTKVKALYIIVRYLPFCFITADLYLTFAPNENPDKYRTLINIYSCFGVISLICSECVFVLRTSALWNNNRIVLIAMMSIFFAIVVSFTGTWFTAVATSDVMTSVIPGMPGCYWSSRSALLFMSFILLFVFQLGLVSLTLICVLQSLRSDNGPLYAVLVKHNIFYYACGLFFSAMNVLMPILSSDSIYNLFFESLQLFILSILATRMHLHLWNIDQHMHGSDAFVHISMFDMSPADREV